MEFANIVTEKISQIQVKPEKKNLSRSEFSALNQLKKETNIVIKKADKGACTVIMDRDLYLQEAYRQLNNDLHYKKLDHPMYIDTANKINQILDKLFEDKYIDERELQYLRPPQNPRPRRFYLVPKIHKPQESWTIPHKMPVGRPIVSDSSSESKGIAFLIDEFIKHEAQSHPSYVQDTYDFIEKIRDIEISSEFLLITMDIESMYTNIEHDKGLEAIKEAFQEFPSPKKDYIIKLLELSLKRNDFEFNDEFFLQVSGTSMGKDWAPHYADISVAKLERDAMSKCPNKPHTYLRFLDDIFIIWTHGLEAFQEFLDIFNSHQPPIKFKANIQQSSIDFLDTTVFKNPDSVGNPLLTKVYFKPTDTHQLLYKTSFHPKHTFKGVIKSQIIRFYRICSREIDFEEAWFTLYSALFSRNYPKRWLRKIKQETCNKILLESLNEGPILQAPSHSKYVAAPCSKPRCMTCSIITKNSLFSNAAFPDTMDGIVSTFSGSRKDHNPHSFNARLDCNSSHIIYLYSCRFCDKQYVGQTGNTLRFRHNRHRHCIKTEDMRDALAKHVKEKHLFWGGLCEVFSLIPIEQLEDSGNEHINKTMRLIREEFWITILNTFEPHGLNKAPFKYLPKPKQKNMIPLVIPFSKTANNAIKIVREEFEKLKVKVKENYPATEYYEEIFEEKFDVQIIAAYKRHKNLRDHLVSSKLRNPTTL